MSNNWKKRSTMIKIVYLNVELSGQSGSNSAAQVTDEAVEECEDFSRIFSPTSAPLIHEPENG